MLVCGVYPSFVVKKICPIVPDGLYFSHINEAEVPPFQKTEVESGFFRQEEIMKRWMMVIGSFFCVSFALFAQDEARKEKVRVVPGKRHYVGLSMGAYFFGDLKAEGAKSGTDGTLVRNIDVDSGGSVGGFTIGVTGGYQITPTWAAEVSAAFGVAGKGKSPTGYEETSEMYHNYATGENKTFTDNDKLSWGGGFLCIDIGASYDFFAAKNPKTPFFIKGKFGLGMFNYFRSDLKSGDKNIDKAGGLRYSTINGWHGGEEPGADYEEDYLLELVEGFYLKPGFDFGVKFGSALQLLLNTHVKVFPAAFGNAQKAVINDGARQRAVGLTLPTWMIPNITVGMRYCW